jgi:cyclic pyranopterin phosphate synthase
MKEMSMPRACAKRVSETNSSSFVALSATVLSLTATPARYVTVRETGRRLGFITPLTHNFCESCNRVRLTCTGTLYMCLGQEDAADLRTPLRQSESDEPLDAAIREAIDRKPKGHDFIIDRRHNRPAVARHMSVTGG